MDLRTFYQTKYITTVLAGNYNGIKKTLEIYIKSDFHHFYRPDRWFIQLDFPQIPHFQMIV